MRMAVPLAALILFLRMNGNLPDFAHFNMAHAEYLLRGWWYPWQMHMRMWHPQEYALWGGMLVTCLATLCTTTRGK